jgi:hypothetical protein
MSDITPSQPMPAMDNQEVASDTASPFEAEVNVGENAGAGEEWNISTESLKSDAPLFPDGLFKALDDDVEQLFVETVGSLDLEEATSELSTNAMIPQSTYEVSPFRDQSNKDLIGMFPTTGGVPAVNDGKLFLE